MPVAETRDVQLYVETDGGWAQTEVSFKTGPFSKNLLSIGKLISRGFHLHMSEHGSYLENGGMRARVVQRGNTMYLPVRLACSVVRFAAPVEEGGSSSSSGPTAPIEPTAPMMMIEDIGNTNLPAEVAVFPPRAVDREEFKPSLPRETRIDKLRARLKQLDKPVYGTKNQLWHRLKQA